MSSGFPVRNFQPAPTPNVLAYAFRTSGVSCFGSSVIEYMKRSRPTRSARSFCTCTRFAVVSGQVALQVEYIMLTVTNLSLMRSSYKRTRSPSCVVSTTLGKFRRRIGSRGGNGAARLSRCKGGSPTTPTAAAALAIPSHALLDILIMLSPFAVQSLRPRVGVTAGIDDLPVRHHRVVLVHDVVAGDRISAVEVAEAEVDHVGIARLEPRHVLAPFLDQRRGRRRPAVDRQRLEFLEVDMDRMVPARALVLYRPSLVGILQDLEAYVIAGEDLLIDLPVAPVLEHEGALDPHRIGRVRETVERRDGGRVLAVVVHHGTVDNDLQDQIALPRGKQPAARSLSVVLYQPVLDVERLSGFPGEIHDHVHAFRHGDPRARDLLRLVGKIAVGRDLPERVVRAQVGEIGQEELIEA